MTCQRCGIEVEFDNIRVFFVEEMVYVLETHQVCVDCYDLIPGAEADNYLKDGKGQDV